MTGKWVTVMSSNDPTQAHVYRSWLESEGFTVSVRNELFTATLGAPCVELQVPEEEADEAERLIAEGGPDLEPEDWAEAAEGVDADDEEDALEEDGEEATDYVPGRILWRGLFWALLFGAALLFGMQYLKR